jgi:short-subunit dehydrogenase
VARRLLPRPPMRFRARYALLAAGLGALSWRVAVGTRAPSLEGQVAFVTGGSRGLGLLLARELAAQGCQLALVARNADELERARMDLRRWGVEPLTIPCDVGDQSQVNLAIQATLAHFSKIDVLVNNAGLITVGPLASMTLEDFEEALRVMYWGTVYTSIAALEHMRPRHTGRIVNITSIGGKVSVPHLLPYSSAKFAAIGFSEGLRAELAGTGISVTTVVPGLMRTGSHVNAMFHGDAEREFTLFSLAASLPLVSMDAERAARRIVLAARRREAELILSLPARALVLGHGVAPGLTTDALGVVNRAFLPHDAHTEALPGHAAEQQLDSAAVATLTTLGRRAARHFGQRSSAGQAPVEA